MKALILFLFLITSTLSEAARFTLKTSLNNRTLTATDKETGAEGELESEGNFHYGVNIELPFTKSFRWNFGGQMKTYTFDNEEEEIASEEKIDTFDSYIGFKWIMFSRTAIRVDFHYSEDIAFTINGSDKAELFKEGITFIDTNFDQILYLSPRFYAGFKVGTETLISSDEILSRSEIHYGLFMNFNTFLGIIEISGELKNVSKDTDTLDFEQNDLGLNLDYTVRF